VQQLAGDSLELPADRHLGLVKGSPPTAICLASVGRAAALRPVAAATPRDSITPTALNDSTLKGARLMQPCGGQSRKLRHMQATFRSWVESGRA
jgi:hypothetical protein